MDARVGPGGGDQEFVDAGDAMECGGQTFRAERRPADLLILLDVSGSMTLPWEGINGPARWLTVRSAIGDALSQAPGEINWGLKLFPTQIGQFPECTVSSDIEVPVAPGAAPSIMSTLSSIDPPPDGQTPTPTALRAAADYLLGLGDGRPKHILLATDGESGLNCYPADLYSMILDGTPCPAGFQPGSNGGCCGFGQCSNAISPSWIMKSEAWKIQQAGIGLFVMGIALGGNAHRELNEMAEVGGHGLPGDTKYYTADDPASLTAALAQIASSLLDCTLVLEEAPPDPSLVRIIADGVEIPYDPSGQNGWSWGADDHTVVVGGASCDDIKSGLVAEVRAAFGCPPIVVN